MPKGRPGQDKDTGRPGETPGGPARAKNRPRPAKRRRTTGPQAESAAATKDGMRIAKAIARAGLCSRRDAERWITDGRVVVNGVTITSPALDVAPDDAIVVDGKPLPSAEPAQLWRYHKPRGLVTTHRDPQGRPTVFDNLPADLPRVISVGRLDFNTEGLLLLTTDGALARHIELPSTGWLRRYRVRARGRVTQADLDKLKDGPVIKGVRYGPVEAELDSMQGANCWLSIGLREGKNREVRKILASLGLEVNRLIRVSFGPFQLLDLAPGMAEPVKRRVMVDQLGKDVADRFGLAAPGQTPPANKRGSGQPANRGAGKRGNAKPTSRPSSGSSGKS